MNRLTLGHVRTLPATTALCGALASACAQMTVRSERHVIVAPNAAPLTRAVEIADVELEARWTQRGGSVDVELVEHRACRTVETLPAREVVRTLRRPDAMIYWEYALAATALGVAALAFIRPEGFATVVYDQEVGAYVRDPKTGYAIGGVMTALGSGFLIGGIVDSVRSRDGVRSQDATLRREGPIAPCEAPSVPAGERQLELAVGDVRLSAVTDLDGRAHFALPELAAPAEPRPLPATLRVALTVEFALPLVAPYAQTAAAPLTGSLRARPR